MKVTKSTVTAATVAKRVDMQKLLPTVKWGDKEARNSWLFKYMGAMFEAGGGQLADVSRRTAMAKQRFDKIRHLWSSKALHLRL